MATPLQLVPTREERVGVYDLQHLGLYFGRSVLVKQPMPKGISEGWMPSAQFTKVKAEFAKAFFDLCVKMLKYDVTLQTKKGTRKASGTYEVRVELLRNYATGEIRAFVPPQVVKPGFVATDLNDPARPMRDLITGAILVNWQKEWHEYGGWHSHNTMGTTPSGTDDKTEELTPGVYAIFGQFKRTKDGEGWDFHINSSVVMPVYGQDRNKRRTKVVTTGLDGEMTLTPMTWLDTMEWDEDCKATYHEDVIQNIMIEEPEDDKRWEKPKGFKPYNVKDSWPMAGIGHHTGSFWDAKDDHTPQGKWKKELDERVKDELRSNFNWPGGWVKNREFARTAFTLRSIVQDIDEMWMDPEGKTLLEDVLAPILEGMTQYRLVPEHHLAHLEEVESAAAECECGKVDEALAELGRALADEEAADAEAMQAKEAEDGK